MSIDGVTPTDAGEKENQTPVKRTLFCKDNIAVDGIGYETRVPPINILTFYNGMTNNGVCVRSLSKLP